MPLTLTNTSLLPQKFGFVQLKDEVDVQPEEERIGILLPKESKLVQVVFKPRIAQVRVTVGLQDDDERDL